jgi:hypothetical protein
LFLACKGCFHVGKKGCISIEEGIQEKGFSNLRDHTFSSSSQFEGFDADEEINNTMNGTPQEKSNGYMCNIFYDSSNDGTVRGHSFDSMGEGWDEKGNGEKEQE